MTEGPTLPKGKDPSGHPGIVRTTPDGGSAVAGPLVVEARGAVDVEELAGDGQQSRVANAPTVMAERAVPGDPTTYRLSKLVRPRANSGERSEPDGVPLTLIVPHTFKIV